MCSIFGIIGQDVRAADPGVRHVSRRPCEVALLTGGADKPYALGLAPALAAGDPAFREPPQVRKRRLDLLDGHRPVLIAVLELSGFRLLHRHLSDRRIPVDCLERSVGAAAEPGVLE